MTDPVSAGLIAGTDTLGVLRTIAGRGVAAGVWLADRHNWVRIAEVIIGGALFIAGMLRIAAPVIEPAVADAGKVAAVAAV
jgi:hypothetical protein